MAFIYFTAKALPLNRATAGTCRQNHRKRLGPISLKLAIHQEPTGSCTVTQWGGFMRNYQILLLNKDGTVRQVVSTTASDEVEARTKADFLAEEYKASGA